MNRIDVLILVGYLVLGLFWTLVFTGRLPL